MNIKRRVSGMGAVAAKFMLMTGVGVVLSVLAGAQNGVLAQGAGDLVIAPTRVVLEGRTRTAQLTLLNKGAATATYRISAVNMRMEEDGTVREIDKPDPGQKFADRLFRYSPRQVTLKPGAGQAIRILLRKPKDLADGEYRSHMIFRGVPDKAGESVEQGGAGDGIAVRLIPVYGISIPVIVRHGKTSANVSLTDLNIAAPDKTNKLPRLKFKINRDGSRSAFGDITATFKPDSGSEVIIGQIMRLAIYSPNAHRTVELLLRVPDGVALKGGKINLSYNKISDEGGKLISQAEMVVQ